MDSQKLNPGAANVCVKGCLIWIAAPLFSEFFPFSPHGTHTAKCKRVMRVPEYLLGGDGGHDFQLFCFTLIRLL